MYIYIYVYIYVILTCISYSNPHYTTLGTTRKLRPSEDNDDLYEFISKAEFHALHTNHMLVDLGDDSQGNFYARKRYKKALILLTILFLLNLLLLYKCINAMAFDYRFSILF